MDNEEKHNQKKLSKDYKFDEKKIEELFKELDVNHDGRININELHDGLHRLGIHHLPGQAKQIMEAGDKTDDNQLSFEEFVDYCEQHERKLWLVFKSIDQNDSGTVTVGEIRTALEKLGIKVADEDLNTLVKKMDKDKSLQVDWNEWREFHLLNPHAHSIDAIHKFWKHSTYIDIGDDMLIPDDFTEEEKKKGLVWRQLLAGGSAGVVSRTATAPMDRIKVMMQVHSGKSKNNWKMLRLGQKIWAEGGFKSFYRGNLLNCIKIAPESAIKFFAYEYFKGVIASIRGKKKEEINPYERLGAGALAGVSSQSLIYPMEVVKTRLAIGKTGEYSGMWDCCKKVIQKDGYRGLYRGLAPSLIGIVPYAGIDLAVYETLKSVWLTNNPDRNPTMAVTVCCGALSSTCGQLCSYPLALVRTKLQAQSSDPSFTGLRANGSVDMFKVIIRQNGWLGLYRGIIPNFIKVIPAVAVSWVVYEKARTTLGLT